MKWDYERIADVFDGVAILYLEELISFDEKEKLQKEALDKAEWTCDELIEECERRIK